MARIVDFFQSKAVREQRFSELVRPHIGSLYRMGYRWTQSSADAEDLVQETLAKLVDRVDEMEQVEKLGPWLVKVLYRCHIDLYRKKSRSPVTDSVDWSADTGILERQAGHSPEGADNGQKAQLQRDLLKALESLSDEQRDVILLHDTEGYSAAEVAAILGISIGTVKSRLHRARSQLKKFLG